VYILIYKLKTKTCWLSFFPSAAAVPLFLFSCIFYWWGWSTWALRLGFHLSNLGSPRSARDIEHGCSKCSIRLPVVPACLLAQMRVRLFARHSLLDNYLLRFYITQPSVCPCPCPRKKYTTYTIHFNRFKVVLASTAEPKI